MTIIKSCCCCRSLRHGCYASAAYTLIYFTVTAIMMGHFIDVEQRYLSGAMRDPESESFLEPAKITSTTVTLNIILLGCSILGIISSIMLIVGIYRDLKYFLLPWVLAMVLETSVEAVNLVYLGYLQTLNFNPITAFLFTLDFFIIALNLYAVVCVISQFQEYNQGRGSCQDSQDRLTVQYTANPQTVTTSSAVSGRRRSAGRPMPSRIDPEEFSEVPSMALPTSLLTKPVRPNVKKHVQFPDEESFIAEHTDAEVPEIAVEEDTNDNAGPCSLWLEVDNNAPQPDR